MLKSVMLRTAYEKIYLDLQQGFLKIRLKTHSLFNYEDVNRKKYLEITHFLLH